MVAFLQTNVHVYSHFQVISSDQINICTQQNKDKPRGSDCGRLYLTGSCILETQVQQLLIRLNMFI